MTNKNEPPIIIIVEDHAVLRSSINDLLHVKFPKCRILEAKCGEEGMDCALANYPDVVIIDFSICGPYSLDMTRLIKEKCFGSEVVILSDYDNPIYIDKAKSAGAFAYVLKSELSTRLLPVMSKVLSHQGIKHET